MSIFGDVTSSVVIWTDVTVPVSACLCEVRPGVQERREETTQLVCVCVSPAETAQSYAPPTWK